MNNHGCLKFFFKKKYIYIYFLKYKCFLVNSTDLLKTKTLTLGRSRKLKMKSTFSMHNKKTYDFVYCFVYISDLNLQPK